MSRLFFKSSLESLSTPTAVLVPLREHVLVALSAGLGVTLLWFCLTWRYGFDLADEGFYWYGAQRTMQGEIPYRDFFSYDIGRYYWAAAIMALIGDDGVFGARVSAVAYQAVCAFFGVYICMLPLRQRGVVRWMFSLLVASILTIWILPYYKVYDYSTSMVVVCALFMMLRFNSRAAWLAAGICIGFASLMGKNHGVYAAFGAASVILLIYIIKPSPRLLLNLIGYFILGIIIGYLPMLFMIAYVDGFGTAFVNGVIELVRSGSTNIKLPIPWPWWVHIKGSNIVASAEQLFVGFSFVALLAFPVFATIVLVSGRFRLDRDTRSIIIAAIVASIPYAHYAFSRADVIHLSLGIFPLLIGVIGACATMRGLWPVVLATGLLAVSAVTVGYTHPYLSARLFHLPSVKADVGGEALWMSADSARRLKWATQVVSQRRAVGAYKFLALPDMPGLYAIQHEKMPLWESYSLLSRGPDFEKEEISRLDAFMPATVLLSNHALDGRPELRFSRLRPLIHKWIVSKYSLSDIGKDFGEADWKVYVLEP